MGTRRRLAQLAGPGRRGRRGPRRGRFLRAFLHGGSQAELAYLLAPGAHAAPLGAGLRVEAVEEVGRLDAAGSRSMQVVATVRVRDGASGRELPAAVPARGRAAATAGWCGSVAGGPQSHEPPATDLARGRRLTPSPRCWSTAALLWLAPPALAQLGQRPRRNLGDLLRSYSTQLYGGLVGIVGLVFLGNRRFRELAVFVVMAVVVAWLVFSPDQIAAAARAIGRRVFG